MVPAKRLLCTLAAIGGAGLVGIGPSAAGGGAQRAPPGSIVYQCRPLYSNLCRIDVGSRAITVLTRDGTPNAPYSSPSVSHDGRALAFLRGGRAFVADRDAKRRRLVVADGREVSAASLRVDARSLLLLRYAVETCRLKFECTDGYTGLVVELATGTTRARPMLVEGADWLDRRRLVGVLARQRNVLLVVPAHGCCGRIAYRAPGRWALAGDPAVSPDGRTVAVSVQTSSISSRIALISLRDGRVRLVRSAAPEPYYAGPTWSPDGRWLAFVDQFRAGSGAGEVMIVKAASDARPQRLNVRALVSGLSWGG